MLGGFPSTSKSITALNCSNTAVPSFGFLSKLIYHPLLVFPQAKNFFWIPKSCFYQELFSMAFEKLSMISILHRSDTLKELQLNHHPYFLNQFGSFGRHYAVGTIRILANKFLQRRLRYSSEWYHTSLCNFLLVII